MSDEVFRKSMEALAASNMETTRRRFPFQDLRMDDINDGFNKLSRNLESADPSSFQASVLYPGLQSEDDFSVNLVFPSINSCDHIIRPDTNDLECPTVVLNHLASFNEGILRPSLRFDTLILTRTLLISKDFIAIYRPVYPGHMKDAPLLSRHLIARNSQASRSPGYSLADATINNLLDIFVNVTSYLVPHMLRSMRFTIAREVCLVPYR